MSEKIFFGDKNTFAIRYIKGFCNTNQEWYYAYCHLVLNGQLLGNIDEICLLNTWKNAITKLKKRIESNFELISHTAFRDKSNDEIFELIIKSNQIEEEFDIKYLYLPQLKEDVYTNCYISIDETTDDFSIVMFGVNDTTIFLWKENSHTQIENQLFSLEVKKSFVIKTIEQFLETIEKEYESYPIQE